MPTTTQTTSFPEYIEDQNRSNINIGNAIVRGEIPSEIGLFPAYGGERVAGRAPNELWATGAMRALASQPDHHLNAASGMASRAGQSYTDADLSRYENPYIENVLNNIRHSGEEARTRLQANYGGAWGGTRAAVADAQLQGEIERNLGTQRAQAFQNAQDQFWRDRQNQGQIAQLIAQIGQQGRTNRMSDIDAMMRIGQGDRAIEQSRNDAGYQTYQEARDWPMRMLQTLQSLTTGQSIPQTVTQQQPGGNTLSQLAGLALAGAGLFNAFG